MARRLPDVPKIKPLFTYLGDREMSGPAVIAARSRLDDKTRGFFDFFLDNYQRMRIRPTFRQDLSDEQRAYFTIVKNLTDWDLVADEFQTEVDNYRFITFDLEEIDPDNTFTRATGKRPRLVDQKRVVFALFGTITGRAVLFDLEAMYNGPVSREDPFEPLPPEFKAWICSPDVVVAGSAVQRDIAQAGLMGKKICDTKLVFSGAMSPLDGRPPVINIGSTRRTGLGVQAFFAKGIDHKPMKLDDFVKAYGSHNYRDDHGKRKWPVWRQPARIYTWPKDDDDNLMEHCQFYCYHDATTPAALVAKIFLDFCVSYKVAVKDATIADYLERILGPNYGAVGLDDVLDLEAPDLEDEFAEGKEKTEQNEVGRGCILETKIEQPRSTSFQAAQEDLEEGEVPEIEPQPGPSDPKRSRDNEGKVVRTGKPREGTCFGYWDWRKERENPYLLVPAFGRLCRYCGVGKHSHKDRNGALLCDKALVDDPDSNKCTYAKCHNPREHRTEVCPNLHRRCAICHHRGHGETSRCWTWSEEDWKAALKDFEASADKGVYTQSRRRDERWGFWAHIRRNPFPYFAPAALVAKIFLDFCVSYKVAVKDATIADYLERILGPNYGAVGLDDVLDLEAPDLEDEFAEGKEKTEQNEVGRGCILETKIEQPRSTSFQAAQEDLEEGEVPEIEPQPGPSDPKRSRDNEGKVVRTGKPREGTCFGYWDWRKERENPYLLVPAFGRLCRYCGVGKHSHKDRNGALLCDKALVDDPDSNKCTYAKCHNPREHRTEVCPNLHRRCAICHHRGHGETSRCWTWSEEDWKAALKDFEASADKGVYTQSRRRDERWGFWAHIRRNPFPYFAPYPALLNMAIRDVDEMLGLCAPSPREMYRHGYARRPSGEKRPGWGNKKGGGYPK